VLEIDDLGVGADGREYDGVLGAYDLVDGRDAGIVMRDVVGVE